MQPTNILSSEQREAIAAFAAVQSFAHYYQAKTRLEHLANCARLADQPGLCGVLCQELNRLDRIVALRCQIEEDRTSQFSIPNYYPEGHPIRVAHEARMARKIAAVGVEHLWPEAADRSAAA